MTLPISKALASRYEANLRAIASKLHFTPYHRLSATIQGDYLGGLSEGDGTGDRDRLSIAFNRKHRMMAENISLVTGGTIYDKATPKATKCDLQLSGESLIRSLSLINGRLVGPAKRVQFRRILRDFPIIQIAAPVSWAWIVGFFEADGGFLLDVKRENGVVRYVQPGVAFTQSDPTLLNVILKFIPGGRIYRNTGVNKAGKMRVWHRLVYTNPSKVSWWLDQLRDAPLQGIAVEQLPIMIRAHRLDQTARQRKPHNRNDLLSESMWLAARLRSVTMSEDRRYNFHVQSANRTRIQLNVDQMITIDACRQRGLTVAATNRAPGLENLSRHQISRYLKKASAYRRDEYRAVRHREREILNYVRSRAVYGGTPLELRRSLGTSWSIWSRLEAGESLFPEHNVEARNLDFGIGYRRRGWLGAFGDGWATVA